MVGDAVKVRQDVWLTAMFAVAPLSTIDATCNTITLGYGETPAGPWYTPLPAVPGLFTIV